MSSKSKTPIRPELFPLGSIESRLAMRTMIEAQREPEKLDLSKLSDEELDFTFGLCILNIARNHGPEPNTTMIKRETIMRIEDGANIWHELERTVLKRAAPQEKCRMDACMCRPGRKGGGLHVRVLPAPALKAVEVDESKKELKPIFAD